MEPFILHGRQAGGPLHSLKNGGVVARDYIAGKPFFCLRRAYDRMQPCIFERRCGGTRQRATTLNVFLTAQLYSDEIHSGDRVETMPWELVRKPPIGNARSDRFKVTLLGNHSTRQKIAMLTLAKFFLHEQGIDNAGITDAYFPLIDPNGYPITNFRDGTPVADYHLVIKSPYHCAADEYERHPLNYPNLGRF
jgi:hypothetical protein